MKHIDVFNLKREISKVCLSMCFNEMLIKNVLKDGIHICLHIKIYQI